MTSLTNYSLQRQVTKVHVAQVTKVQMAYNPLTNMQLPTEAGY